MSIRFLTLAPCAAALAILAIGCDSNSSPKKPADPTQPNAKDSSPSTSHADSDHDHDHDHDADHSHDEGHGHSHVRDKMMIADAGSYHVLLTAHLAKAGNELDIFFETPDAKNPQPVAISDAPFEAQATAGEGESQTLKFEPAPADERPAGEKAGTCSHFVAKTPWMKPEQDLLVVAKVTIDGKEYSARWKDFNPGKFAHHVE